MNNKAILKMSIFGEILTDREDGKKAFRKIMQENTFPLILDFDGVISLGSSFGDETLPKLAEMQDNIIEMMNTNRGIRSCVAKVCEDTSYAFEVNYL